MSRLTVITGGKGPSGKEPQGGCAMFLFMFIIVAIMWLIGG